MIVSLDARFERRLSPDVSCEFGDFSRIQLPRMLAFERLSYYLEICIELSCLCVSRRSL